MGRLTRRAPAQQWRGGESQRRVDTLAVEEPLEIRLSGEVVTVTMRLPGDDFDLALGHLLTEGVIASGEDIATMMHCTDTGDDGLRTYNVVEVAMAPGLLPRRPLVGRAEIATGGCGICGTVQVDELLTRLPHAIDRDRTTFTLSAIEAGLAAMRERQRVFDATGGVHAAALITPDGEVLVVREDIGRHNAVDKVIGWAVREGRSDLTGLGLLVSSRAGFEIVQKGAAAGVPLIACVSAASTLAVEAADRAGLTLAAFVRPPRASVLSHPDRVTS